MTDPPMYNVASAVICHTLAIVWSLPLPGCDIGYCYVLHKILRKLYDLQIDNLVTVMFCTNLFRKI